MTIEMSEVEFRTLPEYDGYRFGADGSVWSCWTVKRRGRNLGNIAQKSEQWRRLKAITNSGGYLFVNLKTTGGPVKRCLLIHRLMLLAFRVEKPDGKDVVCHGNGIQTDNRIENLRWGSPRDNIHDSIRHGTWRSFSRERRIANGSPVICRNCNAQSNRLKTLLCPNCYAYRLRTGRDRPCALWTRKWSRNSHMPANVNNAADGLRPQTVTTHL